MKVVYKIEVENHPDFYIGSANSFNDRKLAHLSCLRRKVHKNTYLQNLYNKYGEQSLLFSIVEECENIREREQYYIDTLKPKINICKKVEGRFEVPHKEETKKLISDKIKEKHTSGYYNTEEIKTKISNSLKGKTQSKETIQKRNQSRKITLDKQAPFKPLSKFNRDKKKEKNALIKQQKEQRNFQIIEDLKSGIRQDIIAKKYNLSPSAITELKKKYCPEINNKEIRKGSNNNFSKLTEEQVKEIKYFLKDKVKQQTIADKYNVKLRTIKAIQSGQNWNHITIE